MEDKFLPIGTVVLLKGGEKEIMITSYCIFSNGTQIKDGKKVTTEQKVYEYGGCLYPEGILDSNVVCAFNHDQIEKISYFGYESDAYLELAKKLRESFEQIKQEHINSQL